MKRISFLLVAFVATRVLSAQNITSQIDNIVQQVVEAQYFAGTVLVAKNDQILYHKAFGYADEEQRLPNELNTRFNMASMGKTFTSVLMMQLIEQGKVQLDVPINRYLPAYHIPNGDRITIHHLLTHSSGLTSYMEHPQYETRLAGLTCLDSVMQLVMDMPLAFDTPGKQFEYSNSGFIVLGKIIEQITGMDYWSYLRKQLLQPLTMSNTRTESRFPVPITPPHEAIPYYKFTPGKAVNNMDAEWPAFSDGGTYITSGDIYKFAKALIGDQLLRPETRALMWNPKLPFPDPGYAYGFQIKETPNGRIYGHGGGGKAFTSNLQIREDGYIIIVLANRRIWLTPMFNSIFKVLHGKQPDPIRQTPDLFLAKAIEQDGATAVCADVNAFLTKNGFNAANAPDDLLRASDMLARIGMLQESMQLAEATALLFPNSAWVWNHLAEMHAYQKDHDTAIKYFTKALEIDPNDGFAKMRLANLQKN